MVEDHQRVAGLLKRGRFRPTFPVPTNDATIRSCAFALDHGKLGD